MNSINDLFRGIIRHPLKFIGHVFAIFSMLFTLIKAITHFIPGITIEGPNALIAVISISIALAIKKIWKPTKVSIQIKNSNTSIEVIFGDIFEQSGIRAISVNEFFDSKLGKPVSDKSLHGIFLKKCFGGYQESFDRQVDEQLKGIESNNVEKKVDGKTKSFPIGTTALINVNQDKYILFALAKTDPETCKASSDVNMMWDALHSLWSRARIESGGHELNLALIGSGLSGLGLPTRDLLNLIILSAITETKFKEVTQKIRIVLYRDRFEDLDLRDVKKHWEE
jgi:hypothetical protein